MMKRLGPLIEVAVSGTNQRGSENIRATCHHPAAIAGAWAGQAAQGTAADAAPRGMT